MFSEVNQAKNSVESAGKRVSDGLKAKLESVNSKFMIKISSFDDMAIETQLTYEREWENIASKLESGLMNALDTGIDEEDYYDKISVVRREVQDNVKYTELQGEESGFSRMLDYLSIGYWAGNAGGYIGEQINPSRIVAVENEEMKSQYENSRKNLIQNCSELSARIFQLKDELKDINDYGKEKRIRREIEETRKALEEKKMWLEEEKQREEAENRSTREKACYAAELQQYFQTLKRDGENLIENIYEEARLEIAGRLIAKGIEFNRIIDETFYQKTYVQAQIMGRTLMESIRFLGGRCIVSAIDRKSMEFYHAEPKDLDGIVNQLRNIEGIDCAIFMYQTGVLEYKVSMRSGEKVNVAEVAAYFGGGGHARAAGCTLSGTFHDCVNNLSLHIEKQLKKWETEHDKRDNGDI